MSIPTGAFEVTYHVNVQNGEGDVFNMIPRTFALVDDSPIRTLDQSDVEYQAMMENILESTNETYPASAGYTVAAWRQYTCTQAGDAWPV